MPEAETEFTKEEFKYLNLLAKQYPNISSASTEIINLQAILNLPKGTEHFISDIHGEYEAFSHVLRNASGVIKNHITYILGTSLRDSEKKTLATLIYYPEQKLEEIKKTEKDMDDWYRITLHRLVTICKAISAKYTRSKVRKALPPEFSYIIEELLHEDSTGDDKELYYNQIIESIIRLDQADRFITAISKQRLAIDRLHVIGDIYDRGPRASKIMDILEDYHSVDIQWGNHDISWMGAAAGCQALICNVIRIQARYCNLDTIEEDYGINLIPLATFAMEKYADDPCTYFMPKNSDADALSDKEVILTAKMHKAISIMQFKMEAQIIKRHPEFKMESRLLLDKIDYKKGTITLKGKEYPMRDTNFPTIDPNDPFELSEEEQDDIKHVIQTLYRQTFLLERKFEKRTGRMVPVREYRVCSKHREFLEEYFAVAGITLQENLHMGVMYIQGETLWGEKLSRLATIYILVLKLIYDEQMAAVSSSSHIVTTLGAVNGKAGEFHVLSGLPSPTEMRRTVAFLKKYQIVEPVDVMEELDENSRLVIYPCINTVLLGDDIRELLETFSEEEDSGDKTGVQSALENLPE